MDMNPANPVWQIGSAQERVEARIYNQEDGCYVAVTLVSFTGTDTLSMSGPYDIVSEVYRQALHLFDRALEHLDEDTSIRAVADCLDESKPEEQEQDMQDEENDD